MSARGEIENVLNKYTLAYDDSDWTSMADCFTADAVLTMRIAGGDLIGPFEGRDAIMKLMTDSAQSQTDQRRHLSTNLFIKSEDSNSAATRAYLTLLAVENGEIRLLSSGYYEDQLVNEDQTWRLSNRHIELDLPY